MIVVDCAALTIRFGKTVAPCTIGHQAIAAIEKREGDGGTPLGSWPVRAALLRRDKGYPPPSLPWRWIRPNDGWSDDPFDAAYNRPVRHPHSFSAETLHRADDRYDVVLVLGYNDEPTIAGRGSAIFLHLRGEGPTQGCVGVDGETMRLLLRFLTAGESISIIGGHDED